MTTRRLGLVLAILVLGLGGVFVLPSKTRTQQAGIVLELPRFIAPDWLGEEVPVTEIERRALAADTGFARRRYVNRAGDQVFLGIVLSGEDMANSIHRPERCLIAQGWDIQSPVCRRVEVAGLDAPLEVTRLVHTQQWAMPGRPPFPRRDLTYYWFIGSRDRTASHLTRTFLDIRDRLLHGENQRWAYVTAEALVMDSVPVALRGGHAGRTEEETARVVEEFLAHAVPTFAKPPPGDAGDAGGGLAAANP